ncbi:MAG: sigma-70 family RNA polymerase sigma factor [Phycisphaerae bacterium]|nr:sigma-70 family RNA polymerase sigma factor [Phycisphaerae bacterium]
MRREKLQEDLYEQLRRQAERLMRGERLEHTLTATALVHEAYLHLGNSFANEAHFYAAAATAMRRVLIDGARARRRLKRGGGAVRVELSEIPAPVTDDRLIALDIALDALAGRDASAARVVELHHFAGLSHERVAETMGITVYEARRQWTFARAWLKNAMAEFSSTAQTLDDA